MPTNIDQLQIEIETQSEGAVKGLKELKKALSSLKKLGNAPELDNLATKLEKISNIKFNNLKQLNALGETFKQVKRLTKEVNNLKQKMSSIPDAITTDINVGGNAASTMGDTGDAVEKLPQKFNKVQEKLDETRSKFKQFGKDAQSGTKKAQGGLLQLFKIVVVYGTAFRLWSSFTSGVSEGLKNLSQYNDETSAAMSKLSTMALQLKNSIGAALYPVIVSMTPALQTMANAIIKALNAFNQFVAVLGGSKTYIRAKEYLKAYGDEAKKTADKVKKSFAGMDEITVIGDKNASDSEDNPADMFEEVEIDDSIKNKLSEILGVVGAIGAGIGAWALSKTLIDGITWLKSIKPADFSWSFTVLGAATFLADLDRLRGYIEDISKNGLNFTNVTGALSEFAGLMGDCLMMLGQLQWAGALKAVQGIGEIVSGISDISQNGASIDNVTTIVTGLTNLAMAVGLFTGKLQIAGGAAAIQGFTTIIHEIATNWDAIKSGDWSGVDIATMAIGAVEVLGGLATALGAFSKLKGVVNSGEIASTMKEVGGGAEAAGQSVSELASKMKSLAKNLAMGIVIIAEVAVAAGLVVGAIWGLGLLLQQVATAWQPVIDNGSTVLTAVAIGTGILLAIGVVTAVLGAVGTSLIVYLALGIAMLALIGVAAGLFLVEIWAIGMALQQIAIAWQPVLDNSDTIVTAIAVGTAILLAIGAVCVLLGIAAVASCGMLPLAIAMGTLMLIAIGAAALLFIAEIWLIGKALDQIDEAWEPVLAKQDTIAKAIEMGTELLIGIGIATAALGVATVATGGLLPIAIGLGTAMLVQLSDAFVRFCSSLISVVTKLIELASPLETLNGLLPNMKTHMDAFTSYMGDFAQSVIDFTAASAIAGIAATVDKVIGFFTTDPVERMNNEVNDQIRDFEKLIPALEKVNALIIKATALVGEYNANMGSFESATGNKGGLLGSIVSGAKGVINGLIGMFEGMANGVIKGINAIVRGLNKISFNVPDWVPGIGGRKLGFNIREISQINIPRFATGGFPEDGLFMANHGEVIGKFSNGQTAVANNEQIIEGISGGVYAANREQNGLLREQNNLLRQLVEKQSNGQIDVTTITSAMMRKNRRDGKTVVPVGI